MILLSRHHSQHRGVTFLELLVAIAVLGILAAIAVPYYGDYIQRQRLIGATEALYGVTLEAKRLALSNNRDVSVIVKSLSATDWCATVGEVVASVAADCTGGWVTQPSNTQVKVSSEDFPGIELLPSETTTAVAFQMPGVSASSTAAFSLVSPNSWVLQVGVADSARVSVCGDVGQYNEC